MSNLRYEDDIGEIRQVRDKQTGEFISEYWAHLKKPAVPIGKFTSLDEAIRALKDQSVREAPFGIPVIGVKATSEVGSASTIEGRTALIFTRQPLAHVTVAHEIGHIKRGQAGHTDSNTIREEEEAWKIAVKSLRRAGEWSKDAQAYAIDSLASYYEDTSDDPETKATEFFSRL